MPDRFPDVVPVLADGVVTLRAHGERDLDAIVEQATDPESVRWTTVPTPYGQAEAREFLAHIAGQWDDGEGSRLWAIEAADDDGRRRFAGTVDLRPRGAGQLDLGFGLHPWARGRGVMARAVRLACAHGFDRLDATTVQWRAVVGNWGSRRVAWACGFRVDGTVRDLLEHRGRRLDGWVGSLRKGEPMRAPDRWLGVPVLEGGGFRLRPWREADLDRVVEGSADQRTQRWLTRLPAPYTRGDAEGYLATCAEQAAVGAAVHWCIADAASDACVGSIAVRGLDEADRDAAEIGYWAHPSARGRGLMSSAARLVVRHAVIPCDDGGLGLRRLTLRAAADNAASRHVAEAAGFRPAGRFREGFRRRDGSSTDLVWYDLLAEEVVLAPPGPVGGPGAGASGGPG